MWHDFYLNTKPLRLQKVKKGSEILACIGETLMRLNSIG